MIDVLNEEKLLALGTDLIAQLRKATAEEIEAVLAKLDGWTVTITLHRPVKNTEQTINQPR